MHKLESILENVMYKILGDFEIQTDHSILARRPDLVLAKKKKKKKKNCHLGFCSSGPQNKSKKIDKYLDLASQLK